ncbi:MAG TPA: hypothetical protein DCL53_02920, partial [Thauera sp.]|nr:hypothetical protein [Thauera sp.]
PREFESHRLRHACAGTSGAVLGRSLQRSAAPAESVLSRLILLNKPYGVLCQFSD